MNLKQTLAATLSAIILTGFSPLSITAEENLNPGNAIGGGAGNSAEIVGVGTDVMQQVPADGVIGTGSADGTATSDSATTVVMKDAPVSMLSQTRVGNVAYPQTCANQNGSYWSPMPATLPIVLSASDNNSATAGPIEYGEISDCIRVQDFGFSIPAGAVIEGVMVNVEKSGNLLGGNVGATDYLSQLIAGSPSANRAHLGAINEWPGMEEVVSYGSPSDLWGLSLTPASVNNSNFAYQIQMTWQDQPGTATIDHIAVSVYYTLP